MIRISSKYSISRKDGYFQSHEHAIKGEKSKHAGDECICVTKTYPCLLSIYTALTDAGEGGEQVVAARQTLLDKNLFSVVRRKSVLGISIQ